MALQTAVTKLLNIRYPVIQGGMIWVSGWKLAAACSRAGALGLIGAGSMDPELLRHHIQRLREACPKGGWGVNLPIFFQHAEAMIQVIEEENVPVVVTSGGSPGVYTARLKEVGRRVLHVTSTPKLALKCQAAGVDAVVVEGFEAGGHNGRDELTTMTLVGRCVDMVDIPVIAAGGIADGRSMAAALALGAAGVQVGTALVASEESSAHPAFKQAVIEANDGDTALLLRQLIPVRTLKNQWAHDVMAAEARGADKDTLLDLLGEGRSRRGMFEGDRQQGELEIGQAAAGVQAIRPAGEIIEDMVAQCRHTIAGLAALQ